MTNKEYTHEFVDLFAEILELMLIFNALREADNCSSLQYADTYKKILIKKQDIDRLLNDYLQCL